MCAHNEIGRKTRRWQLCVFYGLLNIVMTNAWVIFTSCPANRLKSRHDFTQDLAYHLARPHAQYRYIHHSQHYRRELRDQIQLLFQLDDDGGQEVQQHGDDEGPPAPPPAPPRPAPDQAVPDPSTAPDQAVPGPSTACVPPRFEGGRILDEKRQRCGFCHRDVK